MRFASLLVLIAGQCQAYSVLTHEAVIDSLWESNIRPLLLKRFPNSTPEQLKEAHAYVYGGSLVQDLGYVPLGSKDFSNLAHYVRSGDFVTTLIGQASSLNDFAFALGTLAHYSSDSSGHPVINRIEPTIYKKLHRKYGSVVTYEDDPSAHLKTEFSLDVIQVARGLYAPDAYHGFIGFEVAQAALERGFETTYGIPLSDLFLSEDLAIGTYRFSVGKLIPEMTRVAWSSKREDIENLSPGITKAKFVYSLPGKEYKRYWNQEYSQPGIFARFLAFLFRLIPTFGPFKPLGFEPVPQQGEQMFLQAYAASVERYRTLLTEVGSGKLKLAEINLDTGAETRAGRYKLADQSYEWLVGKLADRHFDKMSPELRADILNYFSRGSVPKMSKKTMAQIEELRSAPLTQPAGSRSSSTPAGGSN